MSGGSPLNQDEVESQLSAMFDGELPAAECELLSRRLDRDGELRSRWAHYALIGAAMRCEPVAGAGSDFAARVASAVSRAAVSRRGPGSRRQGLIWQGALAAMLVVAVAGFSIVMLRNIAIAPTVRSVPVTVAAASIPAVGEGAAGVPAPKAVVASVPAGAASSHAAAAHEETGTEKAGTWGSVAYVLSTPEAPADAAAARAREAAAVLGVPAQGSTGTSVLTGSEPWSYVTPPAGDAPSAGLRTELVDYIVAHSEYSTPLVRSDLLSELIGGEEAVDVDATPVQSASGR